MNRESWSDQYQVPTSTQTEVVSNNVETLTHQAIDQAYESAPVSSVANLSHMGEVARSGAASDIQQNPEVPMTPLEEIEKFTAGVTGLRELYQSEFDLAA